MSLGQGRTVDLGVAHMRVLASGAATNSGAFALTEFSGTAEGAWTVPHHIAASRNRSSSWTACSPSP